MVNRVRREMVSKRRSRKVVVIGPKPMATGRRAANRAIALAVVVARVATRAQAIPAKLNKPRKAVASGLKPTATGRRAASRATALAVVVARVATRVQEIRVTVSKPRAAVVIGPKSTVTGRREATHATVLAVVVARAVRRVRAMLVKAGRLTAIASSVAINARVRAAVGVASAPVVRRRAVMAPR
ncbi:hypothetical protein O4G98_10860 [Zoogloeaceae bacterium G21618-S1]|nr:hypothetical protein [Zoogloeaceae bacterium G21618-S1]